MKKRKTFLALAAAIVLGTLCTSCGRVHAQTKTSGWEREAANVTIIRDNWGIPHVYGKTDADAVFGVIYAQSEDDFNRVETNFLNGMGRLAEAEGEAEILPRPADEVICRSGRHEGKVRGKSSLVEVPDERLGRRLELLSL